MEQQIPGSFASLNTDQKLECIYNVVCTMHSDVTKQLREIDTRVNNVESRITGAESNNAEIRSEVDQLKQTINTLRQDKILSDIIIHGVPECEQNESDLFALINSIMQEMKYDKPYTITAAHRIGRSHEDDKQKERSIVVQFANKQEKYDVLTCKKKVKVTCNQIQLNSSPVGTEDQVIYFDERLTKTTAELYHAARLLRKKKLVKYAWIRFGALYIKKSDDTEAIRIHDIQQLRAYEKRRKEDSSPELSDGATGGTGMTNTPVQKKQCNETTQATIRVTRSAVNKNSAV